MLVPKENRPSVYFDRPSNSFVGVTEELLKSLSDSYPNVDVGGELSKMKLWLSSAKGKQRKGNIGFIMNWMNNATPTLSIGEPLDVMETDSPLGNLMLEYLDGVWKNSKHIYEFNRIRHLPPPPKTNTSLQ